MLVLPVDFVFVMTAHAQARYCLPLTDAAGLSIRVGSIQLYVTQQCLVR